MYNMAWQKSYTMKINILLKSLTVGATVIKNCEPLVLGPALAILSV